MANRTLTSRKDTPAENFATKLREIGFGQNAASSPDPAAGSNKPANPIFHGYMDDRGVGGSPYPHAGVLAGLLGSQARQFYAEINIDPDDSAIVGDVDDAGNKIAAADDLEIDLGFRPLLVIWGQQKAATTSEIFVKMRGLDFAAVKNYALRMLLEADMSDAGDIAWVNSRVRLNNIAEDNTNFVTILNGSIIDNTKHFLIAVG